MKRLNFEYYMQIDYDVEIKRCSFTIKCIPNHSMRQTIRNFNIEIFPETEYSEGIDGFQNLQIFGLNDIPHNQFYFRITGTADVGLSDYEELENDNLDMIFAHPYGKNRAGENIKAYYRQISPEFTGLSGLDLAKHIMHRLHKDFRYQVNSTDIHTSAEDAFTQGCGVCQDYAHIFISLLQEAGISARYVTGLLIGEGASHAWVEVLDQGKWYGLDPTNDMEVFEQHIKIGIGRDAHDCMINRGIIHGYGNQNQTIKVSVFQEE